MKNCFIKFTSIIILVVVFTPSKGQARLNKKIAKKPLTVMAPRQSTDILQDRNGNIWYLNVAQGGVNKYNGKTTINYNVADGLSNKLVWDIMEDNGGNIWFGSADGITKYDGKKFTKILMPKVNETLINSYSQTTTNVYESTENFVVSIIQDNKGLLWFGTPKGIFQYDGKKFKPFKLNNDTTLMSGLANEEMMQDTKGNVWLCGRNNKGFHCYDGTTYKTYHPPGNTWGPILGQDKDGFIWLSTWSKALYKVKGNQIIEFGKGQFKSDVTNMAIDSLGNIWFNNLNYGLTYYNGNSFTHYSISNGMPTNSVLGLIIDNKGKLWFRSIDGLGSYDGKKFNLIR